jgi:hypothetical protein
VLATSSIGSQLTRFKAIRLQDLREREVWSSVSKGESEQRSTTGLAKIGRRGNRVQRERDLRKKNTHPRVTQASTQSLFTFKIFYYSITIRALCVFRIIRILYI